MSIHQPDRWVILKLTVDGQTHYRVFGGWSGGYLDGDSWRLNSGIVDYQIQDDKIHFQGQSGSEYVCSVDREGMTGLMGNVLANWRSTHTVDVISFQDFQGEFHVH